MKRFMTLFGFSLILAGCGNSGGEDFVIEVPARPTALATPFLNPELSEMRQHFTGLRVIKSRPDDHSVLFTIPATSSGGKSEEKPTTIRLTFEPVNNGTATRVHAAVDVSDVLIMDKGRKSLNEATIVASLRKAVKLIGEEIAHHKNLGDGRMEFATMLSGVAVMSNDKLLAQFNRMQKNGGTIAFGGDDTSWSDEAGDESRKFEEQAHSNDGQDEERNTEAAEAFSGYPNGDLAEESGQIAANEN